MTPTNPFTRRRPRTFVVRMEHGTGAARTERVEHVEISGWARGRWSRSIESQVFELAERRNRGFSVVHDEDGHPDVRESHIVKRPTEAMGPCLYTHGYVAEADIDVDQVAVLYHDPYFASRKLGAADGEHVLGRIRIGRLRIASGIAHNHVYEFVVEDPHTRKILGDGQSIGGDGGVFGVEGETAVDAIDAWLDLYFDVMADLIEAAERRAGWDATP